MNFIKKALNIKTLSGILVALLVTTMIYVVVVSQMPKISTNEEVLSKSGVEDSSIVGVSTVSAYIHTLDFLLNKTGGYTANDIAVKMGVFDNMPSFERGVVAEARELSYILRDQFSRSNSNDTVNRFLKDAHPAINFNDEAWNIIPGASSESNYSKSLDLTSKYLAGIMDPSDIGSQFYTRANSLERYFEKISQRLGDLSQQLSSSRGDLRENTDLANDKTAQESTVSSSLVYASTPWMRIDNVFWQARGETWALLHYLRAIEHDFAATLGDKNALPSLRQIIRELEKTQQPLYSPMILNGSGFGITPNYSLTLANYISRAKSSIQDLQRLLDNG